MKQRLGRIFEKSETTLIITLICICVGITALKPAFLSKVNILNVLRQVSMSAIAGYGIVLLLLLGEIDLSIGAQQAAVGIVAVYVLNATGSVFLGVLSGLLTGMFFGALIGILSIKGHITSFIITLGLQSAIRGAFKVITNASSIPVLNQSFTYIGTGHIGVMPVPVLLMILLFTLMYFVLNYTVFGRQVYAIGGNRSAAEVAGLPTNRIKMISFLMHGFFVGLAAVILAGRLNSAQPNAGDGFEMKTISACILGGVSMSGGRGKITGAILGVLIIGVLSNGLTLLQVSSFWQDVVSGLVMILAVYLDTRRQESADRKLVAS